MVAGQGLVRQTVDAPGLGVVLDLLVPHIGLEFGEPPGKLCHFAGGEAGDVLFDFLKLGHAGRIARKARGFHRVATEAGPRLSPG